MNFKILTAKERPLLSVIIHLCYCDATWWRPTETAETCCSTHMNTWCWGVLYSFW